MKTKERIHKITVVVEVRTGFSDKERIASEIVRGIIVRLDSPPEYIAYPHDIKVDIKDWEVKDDKVKRT